MPSLKNFTLIKAAGGFVLNESKEVLMMFRRGEMGSAQRENG
jgi:hypothetical protein